MDSRYRDGDAAKAVAERPRDVSELLALRTYTARLLGSDPSLVLHGGGNTSVKAEAQTVFGERVDVLHVKGSGWDLATIEPAGHPAVRLRQVSRLLELATMSDEQMVNELRLALLDASAPTPSVETLLHAALPARFIDHTHADAVLAICDQAGGERICRGLYGDRLLWIPYVMPGFGLAKACKAAWDAAIASGHSPTVMILERHGIFTFGETAKQSYERMIEAVSLAERRAATGTSAPVGAAAEPTADVLAGVLPVVRGVLAGAAGDPPEHGPVLAFRTSPQIAALLARRDVAELVERGCATPDHVLRTKSTPLLVADPNDRTGDAFAERLTRDVETYARSYDVYFEQMCAKKDVSRTKLDPWPRVLLLAGMGVVGIGRTKREAEIVADVYEHTARVILDAEAVGAYSPVSRDDLFDVEYWSLEQAKLKKAVDRPLGKRIAVVTGAASGIGLATATRFLELGAHVVACDRDEAGLDALQRGHARYRAELAVCRADVTLRTDVEAVFHTAARAFGGVDVVVSNAGTAPEGDLDTEGGEASLRASLETNLFAHVLVASEASVIMRRAGRGGCLLFNVSKAAFNPGPRFGPYAVAKTALLGLMRQYAIDLAPHGIRANAVNADRVRTGIFSAGVVESRAAARGLSVDDYFRSNLLRREVTGSDVAQAFAYLAAARSTTGAVLTVDGGNPAAFPR